MNVFEFVIAIILITTIGSIIGKHLHNKHRKDDAPSEPDWSDWGGWGGQGKDPSYSKKEMKPYLEKIDALEERIRVLERIVTDKSERLAREIDDLK